MNKLILYNFTGDNFNSLVSLSFVVIRYFMFFQTEKLSIFRLLVPFYISISFFGTKLFSDILSSKARVMLYDYETSTILSRLSFRSGISSHNKTRKIFSLAFPSISRIRLSTCWYNLASSLTCSFQKYACDDDSISLAISKFIFHILKEITYNK